MKIEKVLVYLNYALFLRVAKSFGKNLKQIFHCFSSETSAFNSKCEKSDKRCFNARAWKINLCSYDIYRMGTQLHAQPNHEI